MAAVRAWGDRQATAHPELVRLAVFGSYARGDAGVGSDLDLIAIVRRAAEPFERRAAGWDVTGLPVPAEVLVYTEAEWRALRERGARFAGVVEDEAVWVLG
jgi:predicted nucleotidyltransferase